MAKLDLLEGLRGIDGVAISHPLVVDTNAFDGFVQVLADEVKANVLSGKCSDGVGQLPPLTEAGIRSRQSRGQSKTAPRGAVSQTVEGIRARKTTAEGGRVYMRWIIDADEAEPGKLERILGGTSFEAPTEADRVKAAEKKAADDFVSDGTTVLQGLK
jgi:hypothetical protein